MDPVRLVTVRVSPPVSLTSVPAFVPNIIVDNPVVLEDDSVFSDKSGTSVEIFGMAISNGLKVEIRQTPSTSLVCFPLNFLKA